MCLYQVYKNKDYPEYFQNPSKIQTGYKIFRISENNKLTSLFKKEVQIKKRRWLKAKQRTINNNNNQSYKSGFHIYLNKNDTKTWIEYLDKVGDNVKIAKVKFKNPIHIGKDKISDQAMTIVAKNILITEIL